MKKIAVVHYMPLEYYPPVTNFLNYIGSLKNSAITVFSATNTKNRKEFKNNAVGEISRVNFPVSSDTAFTRFFKYFKFNFNCFFKLLRFNPSEIIYFESYSAGAVYWYLRFFGKKKNLKVHYHEYSSPEWYDNGMRLVKLFHSYETKFLYSKADWISHTNQERIDLFLNDHPYIDPKKMHVVPNYPPKSWNRINSVNKLKQSNQSNPLKTIYVGSLSLEATYIKEYCEWIGQQEGKVTFDIYSYNLHEDTRQYLRSINLPYINFYDTGVEYDDLPQVLEKFDVGVILYKGLTENYVHNAPNKLFEYLVCGLEVWFSHKMKGCFPYISKEHPRILPVDFCSLDSKLLVEKANSDISKGSTLEYTSERALKPLVEALTGTK